MLRSLYLQSDSRVVASRVFAAPLTVTLALVAMSYAVADTWDNSAGNGQWSTGTNWQDNSEPGSGDAVLFPSPVPLNSPFITLSSGELAHSMIFNESYGLASGTLNVTTGTIGVAAGELAAIASTVIGSAGLTKTGPGTLSLSGTNTFSGTVSVNDSASVLLIRSNAALGAVTNPVNLNWGILRIDGAVNPSIAMSRVITTGALGGTIEFANNPTVTLSSAMGATGNPLTLRGAGTLVLNNGSQRTGTTFASDCTVRLNNAAGLGSGSIVLSSGARLELSGGVNYVGFTTLNTGTALAGGGGGLGIFGGTCYADGTTVLMSGGPQSTDTLRLGNAGGVYRFGSGTVTIVSGAGTVQSNVPQEYEGDWQVDGGTLRVGHGTGLGTGTSPIVVNAGGALYLDSVSFDRPITLNNGSRLVFGIIGQVYNTVTVASGAAVALEMRTSGTERLGVDPNALTGGGGGSSITVSGAPDGVIQLHEASDYVGNWTLSSAASIDITAEENLGHPDNTVTLAGGTLQTSEPLELSRNITASGGALAAIGPDTTLTLLSPLTAGSGMLETTGDGTVILTAASSRTGETFVERGTLQITDASALGVGGTGQVRLGQGMQPVDPAPTLEIVDVTLNKPIRFDMQNATLRGVGANAMTSGQFTIPSGARPRLESGPDPEDMLTIAGPNNALTGGGGQSRLTVGGAGRVVLTRSSNYFGTWVLESGTLEVGADDQLGASAAGVTLAGGTFIPTSSFATSRLFSTSGPEGGTIFTPPNVTLSLNAGLGSAGGTLTKAGPGTLVLNGGSSRGGSTAVDEGVLHVANTSGSATGFSDVAVADGATLRGTGTIAGPVQNDGTAAPGTSAGRLTLQSTYTQGPTGSLDIEIGGTTVGTGYDRLAVGGAATLGGALNVSLTLGFDPADGNTFDIMTAGSISGTFATASLPALSGFKIWRLEYLATAVRLRVIDCGPDDADSDGVNDSCDNCPNSANADQADADSDGIGDVCDNCPQAANAAQSDADSDTVGDDCDNCDAPNPSQADIDSDGLADACDNCPGAANADQADADLDGIGDACDPCSLGLPVQTKLIAAHTAMRHNLGRSCAIDGDTIVLGATGDTDAGIDTGSASVFVRSGATWVEQAKLICSDPTFGDNFGLTVSISGDTVAVGAVGSDDAGTGSGSAYMFVRNGAAWSEQQKLTALDAAAGDSFGRSIAVDGDMVIVGATDDDDAGNSSGSAYVFVRSGTTWFQLPKLTASDAASGDQFGYSAALAGNTAVISAPGDDDAGGNSGAAYVFVRNGPTWSEQARLTAADPAEQDQFGIVVALAGDTAVIGANLDNDPDAGDDAGSAYVFVRNGTTWTQQAKLTSSDLAERDFFGGSVAIEGDSVLVGALADDDGAEDAGAAYLFARTGTTWAQQTKITAADSGVFDGFGFSAAISIDTVVVGAWLHGEAGEQAGAGYAFNRSCATPGDMSCDGAVDVGDVGPFALALTDPVAYQQQFPNCDRLNGNMNQDAELDGLDVGRFVDCVVLGVCP